MSEDEFAMNKYQELIVAVSDVSLQCSAALSKFIACVETNQQVTLDDIKIVRDALDSVLACCMVNQRVSTQSTLH